MSEKYLIEGLDPEKYENILFQPRTGTQMKKATLHRAPIYLYSDLCKEADRIGSMRMLANMAKRSNWNIILLQDPSDMRSGHWLCIVFVPRKRSIYFFSSYGKKPDVEKVKWLPADELLASHQKNNIFNDGLRDFQRKNWTIHYNDHAYQKYGEHTATCGIYVAAFIRSGLNPDEFLKRHEGMHLTPKHYYDMYFR